MKIDTNNLISVTEASNKGVSKLVSDASASHEFVLVRNNQPAAAIVGIEKLERLQRIEELEDDLKLLAVAVTRMSTDTGQRVSLEEAATRFGIDLDEIDKADEDD